MVSRAHAQDPGRDPRAHEERHRRGHRDARCPRAREQCQSADRATDGWPAGAEAAQQAGSGGSRPHGRVAGLLPLPSGHASGGHPPGPARPGQADGGRVPCAGAAPGRAGQAAAGADLRHSQRRQVDADQHDCGQACRRHRRRTGHHQDRAEDPARQGCLPLRHPGHAVAQDPRARGWHQPGRQRRGRPQCLRGGGRGAGPAGLSAPALSAVAQAPLPARAGRQPAGRRGAGLDRQAARRGALRWPHQHAEGGRDPAVRPAPGAARPDHAGDAGRIRRMDRGGRGRRSGQAGGEGSPRRAGQARHA